MAGGLLAGVSFVDLVPRLTKGFESAVEQQVGPALDRVGKKVSSFAAPMTKALTLPILGAAGAIGAGALKIDDALDTIRLKTGLTGEDLGKVEGVFREVAARVPNDFGEVADAVSQVRARMGDLRGEELAGLSQDFLNLSRITGQDLNSVIEENTRLLGDWSISAEESGGSFDFLFKLSQKTGVAMSGISQKLVQFGGPLRQLGFGFEESAALIAKFEKEGVNTELVLGSMRMALGKMAKAGEAPAETLRRVMDEIKNAGDAGKANAKSLELFGARAGPDMAAAIREGRFEVGALLDEIDRSPETINGAVKETDGLAETLARFRNKLLLAIEPLATKLLTAAENILPKLEPFLDWISKAIDWFTKLDPKIQAIVAGVLAVAAGLGPVLAILGPVISLVGALAGALSLPVVAIGAVVAALALFFTKTEAGRKILGDLRDLVLAVFGKIRDFVEEVMPQVQEAVTHVLNVVKAVWKVWGDDVGRIVGAVFGQIRTVIETVLGVVTNVIRTVLAVINGDWGKAWEGLKGIVGAVLGGIAGTVRNLLGGLVGIFGGIFDSVRTVVGEKLDSIVSFFAGLPARISKAAAGMFDGIKEAFKAVINWIIRGWNRLDFTIPGFDPPGPGPKFGGFTLGVPDILELRAAGGSMLSGRSYIVGEEGPELLRMGGLAGRTFSNADLMGALGQVEPGPGIVIDKIEANGQAEPAATARETARAFRDAVYLMGR